MGFWGSSLYANDCTSDIRDTYIQFLEHRCSNEAAYQKTMEEFYDCLNTKEEPLFWYALADTQWELGRLMPEVKKKAMFWLEKNGGLDFWEGHAKGQIGWKKTLAKLTDRLNTPQPREKKIESPADFQYNPGNVGDVFAYQFHTAEAKKMGYLGKYILLQKIGVAENGRGLVCPHFFVIDVLFDEVPASISLTDLRLLPLDVPKRFMPSGRNADFPKLNMSAVLELYRKRNSPRKYMNFVGNFPVIQCGSLHNCSGEFDWDSVETTLLYYHSEWQKYSYQLYENESIVSQVYTGMKSGNNC